MAGTVWILGGAGRTGRDVAEALTAAGTPVVLVGRDAGRLAEVAAPWGLATVVATAQQMGQLIERERPRVVLNTVGPFATTAGPIVQACLAAGSDYLDLGNDVAAALRVLDRDADAASAGRTVVTGAGFGVTGTESIVTRMCAQRPAPARVRTDMLPSLHLQGGALGEALAATIVEGLPDTPGGRRYQGRRYAGGRLAPAGIGAEAADLVTPDGDHVRSGIMPLGELVAAHRASAAPAVVAASGEAPTAALARALLPAGTALLGITVLRRLARRRLAGLRLPARPAPRAHSWARARLEWADGSVAEGWLRMPEAHTFTVRVASEVAMRLAAGDGRPGAFTPAALFGSGLAEDCGGEYMRITYHDQESH